MPRRKAGSNAAGLERTLKALAEAGRLDDATEALVALARGLAEAVDADPSNAALWREYRVTVAALNELATDDDVDDDTAAFWLRIRTPGVRAALGDSPEPGT